MNNNKIIFAVIQINLFLFFLWTTIPIFTVVINIGFVALSMVITTVLIIFELSFNNKLQKFFSLSFIFFLFLVTQAIINFTNNSTSYIFIFDFFYETYFIILILYFYIKKKFFSISTRNLYYFLIFFTLVTSIIGLIEDPEASRFLATMEASSDNPYFISLNANNIAGFNFVHTMPFITMFILLRKKINLWSLSLIIIISIFIFLSNYATALIFLFISFIFYFVPRKLKLSKLFLMATIILIILILYRFQIGILIMSFALLVRPFSLTLYDRFLAISNLLTGIFNPYNDITRFELYSEGFSNVIKNFAFGSIFTTNDSTNHSFLLDYLSLFGIFGLIIYILMLKQIFTILIDLLGVKPKVVLLLIFMAIGLSFFNPIYPLYSLMFISPILFNKYSTMSSHSKIR